MEEQRTDIKRHSGETAGQTQQKQTAQKDVLMSDLVIAAERRAAEIDQGKRGARQEGLKLPLIFAGAVIYAFGMNCFLQPLHLYAGGFMGFAQLFAKLLEDMGFTFGRFNISGVLYYLMNVPFLILSYKKMRPRFVIKTLFAVTMITILLSLIPIPHAPVLEDRLADCIMAGIICGAGIGIILLMGACDGGMNLLGMIIINDYGHTTIGKISLTGNIILYGICLFLFDIQTVIYSLIYATFNSIACDRIHTQNISSQVIVVSKLKDTQPMEVEIMGQLHRGMTKLPATGVFTGENESVFIIFLSKYEVNRLHGIIRQYDPHAFIVETEGVNVDGHFLRKLT